MKKPAIAFRTETQARENLERKIEHLKTMVEAGARPPEVPSSLRKFNSWEIASKQGATFKRNANETISRHPQLRAAAVAIMEAAKAAARPSVPPRDAGMKRARDKARLHLTIRKIAESAYLRSRAENLRLRSEIDALRAQVVSISDEANRLREALELELEKCRARNAELLRSAPSNVRAIRREK
ncbi:hypothetical protein QTI17_20185 [Variovorax sp. J31P179]|uniref:hypothetical protein n=1 Tax=Variovorax sp. J31P179 TaxID=3053508 RepID=UPI00257692C9|nr:hypothetical protein [Variovorax sp. J31P179]MDM0082916.1 hypothetical protein [Variovorax sp. J31P179]